MQSYEDVKMLRDAEEIADDVWRLVAPWEPFAKETVAGQFVRAADSIGANLAESYGRFHYGEKIQFLYYARGSIFETKYWLNRALKRNLVTQEDHHAFTGRLAGIARQINGFARHLKEKRSEQRTPNALKESGPVYMEAETNDKPIFSDLHLAWLEINLDSDSAILQVIHADPRHDKSFNL